MLLPEGQYLGFVAAIGAKRAAPGSCAFAKHSEQQ